MAKEPDPKKEVISKLALLSKSDLNDVIKTAQGLQHQKAQSSDNEDSDSLRSSDTQRFYDRYSNLFRDRHGVGFQPYLTITNKSFLKSIHSACLARKAVVGWFAKNGVIRPQRVDPLLVDLSVERLEELKVTIKPKTLITSLSNARGLLSWAFPGYPPRVIDEVILKQQHPQGPRVDRLAHTEAVSRPLQLKK